MKIPRALVCAMLVITLFALSVFQARAAAVALPADAVAWYQAQGNANDSVGSNNGSLNGGVTTVAGQVGQAFSFNGTDGYVHVPYDASIPAGSSARTIEMWVYTQSASWADNVNTIFEYGAAGNQMFALDMTVFPSLEFYSYGQDKTFNTGLVSDTGWFHVAITYDGSNLIRFYINGTQVDSLAVSPLATGATDLYIGRSFAAVSGSYFDGKIDEFTVYSRELASAEVLSIYNAGSAGKTTAILAPEMDVLGNAVSIASGDVTPVVADHTDFGSAVAGGGRIARTFTITNSGTATLSLTGIPRVQISGADAAEFKVTALTLVEVPTGSLTVVNPGFEIPAYGAAGWDYQGGFDFNNTAGAGWTFGTAAGIAHNGSPWFVNAAPEGTQAGFIQRNTSAFIEQAFNFPAAGAYEVSFAIVRRGGGYPGNDIDVRMDGTSIGNVLGTSQTSDTWATITFTYNCPSAGSHTLSFVGTLGPADVDSAIDDVSITSTTAEIAAGASATFQIEYAPGSVGTHVATITIASDDSDEGSYTFDITGTGIAAGSLDWTADTGNGNGSGNATADGLRIRRNGTSIEFSADGGTSWTATAPYATTTTLTLTGSNADDAFVIDYSGGNPIPSGGVVITGSGQVTAGDAISLTGGSHTTVTYGFVNNNDGSIDIDGSLITYTGLEPITDNSDAVNRVFDFTGGAETITITSVSATQTKVDSTLGESVVFNNPTGSMTLNAGTGDDVIALDSLSSGWGAAVAITLNGDAGDDQFGLGKTVATAAPITVNGAAHTTGDTLSFGQEGDAGIVSSGASPGTLSGGTPSIQTVNYDTVETITLVATTLASGDIIVADRGPYFSTGTILFHNGTSQQVLSTTLKDPYDIALDADGHVVVADYEVNGSTAGIFKINKTSLLRTTISSGGSFEVPFGIKVATAGTHSGKYIVADLDADNNGAAEWGAIFVVDPGAASPGNQTLLSSRSAGTGTDFYWLTGLAVGSTGDIYVCDQGDQANPGTQPPRIFYVDPATGDRTVITSGGNFLQPIGVAVIAGTGSTATLAIADGKLKRIVLVTAGLQAVVLQTTVTFDYPTHVAIDGLDLIVTDAPPGAVAGQRRIHRVVGGVSGGTPAATTITSDGFLEQPRGVVVVP